MPHPLLKARQFHSRIFAGLAILVLLVSQPLLPPEALFRQITLWIGYALVMVGAFGRVYCSAFIGGRKNDIVVREGPFSIVRNPLYVFSFLALVGVGLESGMLLFLTLFVSAFMFYYPLVVAKEEAYLKNKFGEPYENYVREVPRWRPNFQLWKEPDHVDAKPRFLRKTALDAALFFLPLPCFSLIVQLQTNHILPLWLTLP